MKNIHLPNNLKGIPRYLCSGCTSLETINIPEKITKIPYMCFNMCKSLNNVDLTNIQKIDYRAFYGCSSISDKFKKYIDKKSTSVRRSKADNEKTSKFGDFIYRIKSGQATIVEYTGKDRVVDIPSKINGKPVTVIDDYSFEFNDNIVEIIIPDGVTCLESGAFDSCRHLSKIKIPASVKEISSDCFYGCTSLSSINLNCIETIGEDAFYNCKKLSGIINLGSIEKLDQDAFYKCIGITSVSLSDKLKMLGSTDDEGRYGNPFTKCYSLELIDIDPSNKYYKIADGAVYSVRDNWLITYPAGRKGKCVIMIGTKEFAENVFDNSLVTGITIQDSDDGIKTIKNMSFIKCRALKYVRLSQDVEKIPSECFYKCTALEEINLENVKKIGNFAFSRCSSLTGKLVLNNIHTIEGGAFENCSRLSEIEITQPSADLKLGITKIWDNITDHCVNPFPGCTSLNSVC